MNNSAAQIDQSIRKMADESSQLSETIAELTIELAGLIEYEGATALGAFKGAGDAVALLVESVPAVFVAAAASKGATLDPATVSRSMIDQYIRMQPVIDGLTTSVLRIVRRSLNGDERGVM